MYSPLSSLLSSSWRCNLTNLTPSGALIKGRCFCTCPFLCLITPTLFLHDTCPFSPHGIGIIPFLFSRCPKSSFLGIPSIEFHFFPFPDAHKVQFLVFGASEFVNHTIFDAFLIFSPNLRLLLSSVSSYSVYMSLKVPVLQDFHKNILIEYWHGT